MANDTNFQLSPTLATNLLKMICKDYYWLYINSSTTEASGPKKWGRELGPENIDWKSKFALIGKVSQENKLREFNYKLIHRTLVTKRSCTCTE